MKKTLTFLSMALGLAVAAPTFAQDRHRVYEAPPVRTEVVARPESGPGHYSRVNDRRRERAELRREWFQRRARIAAAMRARALAEQAHRGHRFAAIGHGYGAY